MVEVLIETNGPPMSGVIRIPGSPASNFDTGRGKTVVDLINASANGAAPQITSVEVRFTRTMPGQSFLVIPLGYKD